jgi:hypothetical protein
MVPKKKKIENSWYEELDILSEGLKTSPEALKGLLGDQNCKIAFCFSSCRLLKFFASSRIKF